MSTTPEDKELAAWMVSEYGLSREQADRLVEGYNILEKAGYSNTKIEEVLGGCLQGGHDPVVIANKMVKFSAIMQETRGKRLDG